MITYLITWIENERVRLLSKGIEPKGIVMHVSRYDFLVAELKKQVAPFCHLEGNSIKTILGLQIIRSEDIRIDEIKMTL